jgi:hypothetical protein
LGLIVSLVAATMLLVGVDAQAQNTTNGNFDHGTTGFPLTGTHVYVPCASCHINARFKTTPTACFGCHNGMTAPGATSLLAAHPKSTNYCEGCHQTTTWRDYRFIDHVQALGPCANCHNNKIAEGKEPGHPVTNSACNVCHFNTVTWKGAVCVTGTFTGACTGGPVIGAPTTATTTTSTTTTSTSSTAATAAKTPTAGETAASGTAAAGGTAASGKTAPATSTTSSSTAANPQTASGKPNPSGKPDHTNLVANCARCHNGSVAPGKPAKHIATNAPCETCHKSSRMFAGARVDHRSLTAACASCHNGSTAEGRPAQHIMTSSPCDTCHKTTFWSPVTSYQHISPAFVNHGPGVSCDSCHLGNSTTAVWKFPAYKMSCAGCHANSFRPMAHVKFERPAKFYYTVSELRDCSASCHTYADHTERTIVSRNFKTHRAFGGGW